jgi:hypothetical protein
MNALVDEQVSMDHGNLVAQEMHETVVDGTG